MTMAMTMTVAMTTPTKNMQCLKGYREGKQHEVSPYTV